MYGRTYDLAPGDRMTFFVSNPEIDFVANEVGYLAGPPLHIHPHQTEIHYLIKGKLRYHIGEDTLDLAAGEYLCIHPNTSHAWINLYPEPARIVATLTPGGAEGYFHTAASTSLDLAGMIQLAQKYGTEVLGASLAAEYQEPR
jgi:mannose-6-phosphate isomerase-like protein (cupin superfamily)